MDTLPPRKYDRGSGADVCETEAAEKRNRRIVNDDDARSTTPTYTGSRYGFSMQSDKLKNKVVCVVVMIQNKNLVL